MLLGQASLGAAGDRVAASKRVAAVNGGNIGEDGGVGGTDEGRGADVTATAGAVVVAVGGAGCTAAAFAGNGFVAAIVGAAVSTAFSAGAAAIGTAVCIAAASIAASAGNGIETTGYTPAVLILSTRVARTSATIPIALADGGAGVFAGVAARCPLPYFRINVASCPISIDTTGVFNPLSITNSPPTNRSRQPSTILIYGGEIAIVFISTTIKFAINIPFLKTMTTITYLFCHQLLRL